MIQYDTQYNIDLYSMKMCKEVTPSETTMKPAPALTYLK